MTSFISWEFVADSAERDEKAGTATFRVGADFSLVRFQSFEHAQKVAQLIQKAFSTGRSAGIAEVRRLIEFHNFE